MWCDETGEPLCERVPECTCEQQQAEEFGKRSAGNAPGWREAGEGWLDQQDQVFTGLGAKAAHLALLGWLCPMSARRAGLVRDGLPELSLTGSGWHWD